jgi:hypothetical protein
MLEGLPARLSSPAPDNFGGALARGAFLLYDELLFASGFDAGVACAWSATGGECP